MFFDVQILPKHHIHKKRHSKHGRILTCVICAEPRQRVDSKLTVVETDGAEHLSSPLSVLPSRRTSSSISPENFIIQLDFSSLLFFLSIGP
jgi:hypothetical protein